MISAFSPIFLLFFIRLFLFLFAFHLTRSFHVLFDVFFLFPFCLLPECGCWFQQLWYVVTVAWVFFYNTTLTRRMKFAAVKMFAKSHPILNLSSGTTKWATVKRQSFLFSARERGERKWWKRYCTIKFQVSSLCTCEMHRRYRAECGNLTFVVTRRGGMLIVCCIIEFKTSRSLVVVLCSSEFIHVACFVQFYR